MESIGARCSVHCTLYRDLFKASQDREEQNQTDTVDTHWTLDSGDIGNTTSENNSKLYSM